MKPSIVRFGAALLASASFLALPLATAQPVQIAQPFLQPGYQVPDPGVKPKPREEVKVDPKTNPDPKSLELPSETLKKADQLVRQLANPSYRERDLATRELQKMGRASLPALLLARQTESNAEVRLRTDICIPVAEADDMRAKVACFLADAEAKFTHSLPGWNGFKKVVGDDKPARTLFAEVLKNKDMHELLMASELPPNELAVVISTHYRELQVRMNGGNVQFGRGGRFVQGQQMTTPELIILAYLESVYTDKEVELNYNYGYSISNYMYQPDFQKAMQQNQGVYAAQIRKVVTRWLDTRHTGQGAQIAMNFAQQWNMKADICKYASRVLESDTQLNNWYLKFNAIQVIAQNPDAKKYAVNVGKSADDSTVIMLGQKGVQGGAADTILLGDYALGVAIKLSGQNHKDYGLEVLSPASQLSNNNYYFKDEAKNKAEDKRKVAIKKWEAWVKEQPKAEPKKDEPVKEEPKPVQPKPDTPKNDVPVPLPLPVERR